jgi:putative membrane protein
VAWEAGVHEPSDDRNVTETDPDYRFTLANERTFLAWIRTSLALLAGAVALVHVVSVDHVTGAQRALGVVLTLIAVVVAGLAVRRWRTVQHHMRRGADLPANRDPIYLSLAVAGVGVAVGVLLIWFRTQI